MGSSASIFRKQAKSSRAIADHPIQTKQPETIDAECRSHDPPAPSKTHGSSSEHVSSIILLHALSAGRKCESDLPEEHLLRIAFSLPKSDFEGHLEVFHLPEEDADKYWANADIAANTMANTTGIPALKLTNKTRVYEGLFPFVTPLMQAILHCNHGAAEMLVGIGADVNSVTPCDIPYYRSDMPSLKKGASVLMIALYKLYDMHESVVKINSIGAYSDQDMAMLESQAIANNWRYTNWMNSLMICKLLLDQPQIDVEKGFLNAAGETVSAVTIAGALLEEFRGFGFLSASNIAGCKTSAHPLIRVCQRVLTLALSTALSSAKVNPHARSQAKKLDPVTCLQAMKNDLKATRSNDTGVKTFSSVVF